MLQKTAVFKMKRGEFAAKLLMLYGRRWFAAYALLAVPMLFAAIFVDVRWGIVFLMLLFLILPMLLAFLYIYHGLRPVTAANIVDHKIAFGSDSLCISLFESKRDEELGEEELREIYSRHVPYASLRGFVVGASSVVMPLAGREKGFVWVPLSAFPAAGDFRSAMDLVAAGMDKRE